MQKFYENLNEKKDWKYDLTNAKELVEDVIPEAEDWDNWF